MCWRRQIISEKFAVSDETNLLGAFFYTIYWTQSFQRSTKFIVTRPTPLLITISGPFSPQHHNIIGLKGATTCPVLLNVEYEKSIADLTTCYCRKRARNWMSISAILYKYIILLSKVSVDQNYTLVICNLYTKIDYKCACFILKHHSNHLYSFIFSVFYFWFARRC